VRHQIRSHLTYANVMATLAVFLVLGGGTAMAAYVVSSNNQIASNTISGHKPPSGYHTNIVQGSINGTDIADRSGVDTCKTPLTAKLGPLCVGSDGGDRTWSNAMNYCANFGLRLPSVSEAIALAKNYDVPGVPAEDLFWTDDAFLISATEYGVAVFEEGNYGYQSFSTTQRTVCVTEPSA
jgi:hypothetical protein